MSTTITVSDVTSVISRIAAIMAEKRDFLIKIDAELGDGDLGLTMERAFESARDVLTGEPAAEVGAALMKAGMQMARSAPSTMGTLLATGFMRGGKAVPAGPEIDASELAPFFNAFVEGVMARGKAKPGEKTLIDVLLPAVEAMKESSASEASQLLRSGYEAAVAGLERTKETVAVHGRPAYYGEKTVGKADPGGTAALLVLQGFVDHFS